jgi:uncharacterized protein YjbI with pentapeptide repeats
MNLSGTNFREASLYACDLGYANLHKACFVRTDLRGSIIESANLEEANLDSADLRAGGFSTDGTFFGVEQDVNFRGANLSGARLVGSLASNADFSDAIMAKIDLSGADLRGAKFEGADLTEADIKGAQLMGANMKSTILTGVEVEDINNSGVDISEAVTDENVGKALDELEEPLVKLIRKHRTWVASVGKDGEQLDLGGFDLRKLLSLSAERLTALRAEKARWCGLDLTDVQLQSAHLDESDFRSCFLRGADFRASSLKGARFSHADLRNTDFSPLYFTGADGNKKATPCTLEGSNMRYANCGGAKMKDASLANADLSYADFSGCDLRGVDFRGALMDSSIFHDANIEGARFDEGATPDTELTAEELAS